MTSRIIAPLVGVALAIGGLTAANGDRYRPLSVASPTPLVLNKDLSDTFAFQPRRPIKLMFDCVVAGTPVEFPNDIRIVNPHGFTTQAGLTVSYVATFGNTGTVVLPALAPGQGIYVHNAIPGGMSAGAPCTAIQK